MVELPQVNELRLVRALERAGWEVTRVRGSHHTLRHKERGGASVVVPAHRTALRPGTLRAILEKAGVTPDELRELL
jgi:predicted RNA binding protein YcfA (HicA-like mRNA interferase family)